MVVGLTASTPRFASARSGAPANSCPKFPKNKGAQIVAQITGCPALPVKNRLSRLVHTGLRLNASKAGLSLSIGHRGAWYASRRPALTKTLSNIIRDEDNIRPDSPSRWGPTSSVRGVRTEEARRYEEGKIRKKFLQGCLSAREARKRAPWAALVVQADGGYWAFESAYEAARWRSQNKLMSRQDALSGGPRPR